MQKVIKYSNEGRLQIKKGIDILADIVKVTLGAKGRNVIIGKGDDDPLIINDGVAIAKEIQLQNPFHNIGAKICKKVAERTNTQAGDGTTTATILAQAIVQEGSKYIMNGVNTVMLYRQLQKVGDDVVQFIKKHSEQIKANDILNIATISANNDKEIGSIIAAAIQDAGIQGVINVQDSRSEKTWLEKVDGMQIDFGFASPYFATDQIKMQTEMIDARVLIYDGRIYDPNEIIPIMGKIAQAGENLTIFCQEAEGQALATLLYNKVQGTLNSCVVKVSSFGERRKSILQDIAILTGGQVLSKDSPIKLKDITEKELGFAKKIIVSKDKTIVRQGSGTEEQIEERLKKIKYMIENATSQYEKTFLHTRIAKIINGVSIIRIGAQTEIQLRQKKLRVQDALNATKSAIQEGIIPGGGVMLLKASKYLEDIEPKNYEHTIALSILKKALQAPTYQIAVNAGQKGDLIVEKIKDNKDINIGFNALNNQIQNLYDSGVIDPTKVVRCALQNAISIAGLFLTTQAIAVEVEERQKKEGYSQPIMPMHYNV